MKRVQLSGPWIWVVGGDVVELRTALTGFGVTLF